MNNNEKVSSPLACNSSQNLVYQLEAWVILGLLMFWRKTVTVEHPVYRLLSARVEEIFRYEWPEAEFHYETDAVAAWFATKHACLQAIDFQGTEGLSAESQLPFSEFARDYQLDEPWLFIFALLGFLETNHLVNLAIAELQAPDKAPRISLHLLCALVNHLLSDRLLVNTFFALSSDAELNFHSANRDSALTPLDIVEHPLCLKKVIYCYGDVTLPLQRAQIPAVFWSILLGRKPLWPGCKKLHRQNDWPISAVQQEKIAQITPLLLDTYINEKHADPWQLFHGVIVRGNPNAGRTRFCYHLAQQMGLDPVEVPMKIWQEEPLLAQACRYAHWLPVLKPLELMSESTGVNAEPVNHGQTPVAIIWSLEGSSPFTDMLEVCIELPTQADRKIIWQRYLPDEVQSQQLAIQALLSPRSIQIIATNARQLAQRKNSSITMSHIAEARRQLGADKLRTLAQPVFRQVTAEALVMPPMVEQALEVVVMRALKRETLWQGLGETLKATPNPGVRALFVGESGTGKTLAASYIATRLAMPLYRVDLSAVMNKYIGESEKNLAQLMDQAAASDVALLFDEADALFGSRSEGKETGERFANMLTNFLLTRIETHPGIVMLTTNSRERIDNAFTRRLDIIVEFPLPGFEERLHLWRSHLGERGPGEEVYRNLASYCDMAGGQLRNVVLTALVYANENRVTAANVLEGLRAEYRKQGREMPKKLEGLSL